MFWNANNSIFRSVINYSFPKWEQSLSPKHYQLWLFEVPATRIVRNVRNYLSKNQLLLFSNCQQFSYNIYIFRQVNNYNRLKCQQLYFSKCYQLSFYDILADLFSKMLVIMIFGYVTNYIYWNTSNHAILVCII